MKNNKILRCATFSITILISIACYAEGQSLYIHCDKTICPAGDTVWWKGYLLKNGQLDGRNANLLVNLYNETGQQAAQELFPILNGQTIGQVALPDSLASGIYWLRFSTGPGAVNSMCIPISLYHQQDNKLVMMKRKDTLLNVNAINALNFKTMPDTGDYRTWQFRLTDSAVCHCSLSITEADAGTLATGAEIDEQADSAFLHWQGSVFKKGSNSLVKNKSLMTLIVKDSTILSSGIIPIDAMGRFRLARLFFFGKVNLLYQLNKGGVLAKDIRLDIDTGPKSVFRVPEGWYKQDSLLTPGTTNYVSNPSQGPTVLTGKVLKQVTIRAWRSARKELDHQYTSGEFSEPALYSFDVRNEKNFEDIGEYLRANLPGFQGGLLLMEKPQFSGHPLLFYVDEELKTWDDLSAYRLEDIAYIKAFESSFIGSDPFTQWLSGSGGFSLSGSGPLKVPIQQTSMIISIYTRKGKDIRHVSGLNAVAITGYTSIVHFQSGSHDRPTRLWEPIIDANTFLIKLVKTEADKPLRLTVAGITDKGIEINYQTIIKPN